MINGTLDMSACDPNQLPDKHFVVLEWRVIVRTPQSRVLFTVAAFSALATVVSSLFSGPTFPASIDRQSFSKFCHIVA